MEGESLTFGCYMYINDIDKVTYVYNLNVCNFTLGCISNTIENIVISI